MKDNEKNVDFNIDDFDFKSFADELAKEVNLDIEDNVKQEEKESVKENVKDDFFVDMDGIFDEEDSEEEILEDYEYADEYDDYTGYDEIKKKKMPKWLKASIITFVVTLVIAPIILLVCIWLGIYTDFGNQELQDEEFDFVASADPDKLNLDVDEVDWSNAISGSTRYDENVINILLLGEDGQSDQGYRGNSDTMIIVTINKKEKSIKMTSIMRDLYMQIPGYSDNKINSAYCTGGVDLIKKTIEENFKVAIDYTVVVQFDTYKAVIDALGGVDVEINEKEADYINMKCASSGSNLSAGKVHLDGRQCLWFSRIRKIDSDIYGKDDFGRTARQRTVLTKIFEKYKDLSYKEIVTLVTECSKYIQTDLKLQTIFSCVALVLSYDVDEMETLRIPMDNSFEFADVYFESVDLYLSVIMMNKYMEENVDAMHMFIYGNLLY